MNGNRVAGHKPTGSVPVMGPEGPQRVTGRRTPFGGLHNSEKDASGMNCFGEGPGKDFFARQLAGVDEAGPVYVVRSEERKNGKVDYSKLQSLPDNHPVVEKMLKLQNAGELKLTPVNGGNAHSTVIDGQEYHVRWVGGGLSGLSAEVYDMKRE